MIKFELTENHIKLLKHLDWKVNKDKTISSAMEDVSPYGGISIIEDTGLIIFGKPDNDFDPLSAYGAQYTPEQEIELNLLHSELDRALEIILSLGTFKTGLYKQKYNTKKWKKAK